ncbi:MAG: hypothetical protein ACJ8ER_14285 [Allosphingosinicella sp.]
MAGVMTERHLIAYAILLLFLLAVFVLWRRSRRVHRPSEPHLRIDLIADDEH